MLAMEMHIQHVGIYVNRMILECMACLIALQQSMIYYLYVDILCYWNCYYSAGVDLDQFSPLFHN